MKIFFFKYFHNKNKLILYFFLTTMASELSKYLNEQLSVFLNEKMMLAKNK